MSFFLGLMSFPSLEGSRQSATLPRVSPPQTACLCLSPNSFLSTSTHVARLFFCVCVFAFLRQAFSNNFLGSREFQLAADAVDAYKSGDQDALGSVLKDQMWQFLPVEIVRLTRALKPQQGLGSGGARDPALSQSGKESGGGGDAFDANNPAASAEAWNEKGAVMPENPSESSNPVHGYTCHRSKDSLRPGGDGPAANVSIDELLC